MYIENINNINDSYQYKINEWKFTLKKNNWNKLNRSSPNLDLVPRGPAWPDEICRDGGPRNTGLFHRYILIFLENPAYGESVYFTDNFFVFLFAIPILQRYLQLCSTVI